MRKYDTVVFDMDGTLLNTLEDLHDAMNYILNRHGYPEKSLEEVRCAVGNGAARFMRDMLPGGEENPDYEKLLKEYGEYYQSHAEIKTRPYEGNVELLRQLKERNVKVAIVSNKGDGAVKALNGRYFGDLIQTAVGERPGIRRKPAPDSVLEALKLLGSERERAVYVGDSEVDYHTAANAGMACALVSWGFRHREQLEQLKPDYLIDQPLELLKVLEGLPQSEREKAVEAVKKTEEDSLR